MSSPGTIMIYKPGAGDRECFVCLGHIQRAQGWWTCDRCHKGCCIPCSFLNSQCACGSMFPGHVPTHWEK